MLGASALIPIVTLLAQYAPMLASSAGAIEAAGGAIASAGKIGMAIKTAIDVVETIAPSIAQEAHDLMPTIKNVIATLRGAAGDLPEQLDRLDAIEAKIDSDYDAALADARARAAAASNPQG